MPSSPNIGCALGALTESARLGSSASTTGAGTSAGSRAVKYGDFSSFCRFFRGVSGLAGSTGLTH